MSRVVVFLISIVFILYTAIELNIVNASQEIKYTDNTENSHDGYKQEESFEIGGSFGMPSGLNSRYWITEKIAIDSNVGVSLGKDPVFTLDILVEEFQLYKSNSWESRFFYGFGSLFAKENEDFKNNIRIPLGLSFPLSGYPLNFSFYAAPAFAIKPETKFDFNWGIGIRYNFGRAAAIKRKQVKLEREVGKLEKDVKFLKHGLDTTKGKLAETEGRLSNVKGKLDQLKGRLSAIKNRLDKTESELDTTRDELFRTTRKLDNTKNQLDDVRNELKNTKKTLDDKQSELTKKQTELFKAKDIIENAFTGKEKEEEQRKLAIKQKQLDTQLAQLNFEKQSWKKIKKKESQRREQLRKKCEDRGGIIDENGYCVCPENEEWDSKTDKCDCINGYNRQAKTDYCKPCEIIMYNGKCADGGCKEDESKVKLKKGPHKYVCIKRCRKKNEVWSKRKKICICKDGYYRDSNGDCISRR